MELFVLWIVSALSLCSLSGLNKNDIDEIGKEAEKLYNELVPIIRVFCFTGLFTLSIFSTWLFFNYESGMMLMFGIDNYIADSPLDFLLKWGLCLPMIPIAPWIIIKLILSVISKINSYKTKRVI